MAEEELKKLDTPTPSESEQPPPQAPTDVSEENPTIPLPPTPELDLEKPAESAAIQKAAEPAEEKSTESSVDRAVLARVETEKRISLIKAWEESEKTKAENKAYKKLSSIDAWENSKKAALEAELKRIEEKIEKQKAEYVEKMKNKAALIHKEAEEKKAIVEAKRGEQLLKAEEIAAKYCATGTTPKKILASTHSRRQFSWLCLDLLKIIKRVSMWGKGDERHMMDRVHLTTMMREMRKRLREWRVVMGLRMSRLSEESDVLERKKVMAK
ncbi:hypothetical protein V6N12_017467 [Hibiscus sabdariffa]|uniref:Remorin n=1 Tax=Hibiscus sabdariffa TaxID=183260 RepID=A0ABR2CFK4_9ROSI